MARKILVMAILAVCAVGTAFAQMDFEEMAKNTVTVDLGPTMTGAFFETFGNLLAGNDEEGSGSFGFGIGAQYERQLSEQFSVAGRFAYLGTGLVVSDAYIDEETRKEKKAPLEIDLTSFSIEGHVRFYPSGGIFFVDGMLGFAEMLADFSGYMIERVEHTEGTAIPINADASQGFIKFGAKVGLRICFGSNGGFTFESALGYSYGIGLGDTIGQQLAQQMKNVGKMDQKAFDDAYGMIENFIFIGGPRLVLAVGYRF